MSSAAGGEKRRGPLFWVLTGGGLFLVLLFGGLLLFAYIAGTSKKISGLDAARMMIRTDSNSEILEEDPVGNTIRFRNKKTGKEFLGHLDPATHQVKIMPLDATEPESAKTPGK